MVQGSDTHNSYPVVTGINGSTKRLLDGFQLLLLASSSGNKVAFMSSRR